MSPPSVNLRLFWSGSLAIIVIVSVIIWSADGDAPFDDDWTVVSPESEGMNAVALKALDPVLAEHGTDAWLVVRRGKIVHEWYRNDDTGRRFGAASMSKALVGGLGLMLAVDSGILGLNEPASNYMPAWLEDPVRQAVTVGQLADHSSGLPQPREPEDLSDDAYLWETAFWDRRSNLIELIKTEAPFLFEPGSDYGYSGPAYAVLSHVLTQALQGSPWQDLRKLLEERIMTPLGVHPASWTIGYDGDTLDVDGLDLYATWGGAAFTARATARIGVLMLNQGRWNGQSLLSADVVRSATSYGRIGTTPTPIADGQRPAPALGWWSNEFGALPSLPKDAFLGAGAEHRVMVVVPSLDLVLVRYGTRMGEDHWDGDYWSVLDSLLLEPVVEALQDVEQTAEAAW